MSEDNIEELRDLPRWASKFSDGSYLEVGSQLATRDGRRMGNAFVISIIPGTLDEPSKAEISTDSGNIFRMEVAELEGAFYPPDFVMKDVREAMIKYCPEHTPLPTSDIKEISKELRGTEERIKQLLNRALATANFRSFEMSTETIKVRSVDSRIEGVEEVKVEVVGVSIEVSL